MSQSRRVWIFITQVQAHTAWSGPHIVEMLALDFNTLPRCCAQRRKHPALLRQIGSMVLKSPKNWMEMDLRQSPLFNVRLTVDLPSWHSLRERERLLELLTASIKSCRGSE